MKTHLRSIAGITAIALFPASLFAQYCNTDQIQQNISAANFDLSVAGIAQDKVTKLTWTRCAYGQTWENNTCYGVPEKKTWKEALNIATTMNISGVTGWRLPDIKELNTLIDYQCMLPPLNATVFPNAPASIGYGLWTSSPAFVYYNPLETLPRIWAIDLENGSFVQHFSSNQSCLSNTDLTCHRNYILFVK